MNRDSWLMFVSLLPLTATAAYIAVSTIKEYEGRFSLRALFIAMTLVAVLLGLGIFSLQTEIRSDTELGQRAKAAQ
jgi:hypothetical protein